MFRDKNWNKIENIGRRWKLIDFDERQPPTWEKYWMKEREYWGADSENKTRVQHYFGKENTEVNLLKKSKIKYSEYVNYLKHWNGLCAKNEIVEVVLLKKNVIALSKHWTGKIKDHVDLEIWLKRKYNFGFIPQEYFCEIYSFGTIANSPQFPNEHGKVAHRKGNSQDKNELLEVIDSKYLKISDAKFEIV